MSKDPWDVANEASLGPKIYFGQVFALSDFVYISKGEPKVLFDEGRHPADKKFTQIKIDGVCHRADGSEYTINREMIAEFGREWAGIVLPSLKVAGVHPRDLDERWASWEMVNTGRSYHSNTTGEEVQATTFKFRAIYDSEEECRAAEAAHYRRGIEDEETPLPMPEAEAPKPGGDGAERANLAKFLPLLWTQAGQDVIKFGELLQANDSLAKHFDLNSPEVLDLVGAGVAA